MTVKRKDTGEEFQVKNNTSTFTFRTALMVVVLSMHPVGRKVLQTFGFNLPPDSTQQFEEQKKLIENLSSKIDAFGVRIDGFDRKITGFQIDFEKYRK